MPKIQFLGGDNVTLAGLDDEQRQFVYCPSGNVPLILDVVGITPPSPNYFVSRKCCDHYIIMHITKGFGNLTYNDTEYKLKTGDTVILLPGSKHEYFADKDNPFEFIWVNFFCDYMDSFIRNLQLNEPVYSDTHCEQTMLEIFRLAKETPDNNRICYIVIRLINQLLLDLSEKVVFDNDKLNSLAHAIKEELDNFIYTNITIEAVAKKLFISKSRLYREFQTISSFSPYQYVLNMKINMAKSLLFRTNDTVSKISSTLSFADEFHFSNLFKKKTGFSPAEYRKNKLYAAIKPVY